MLEQEIVLSSGVSWFDRFVAAVKTRERYVLIFGAALQIVVLAGVLVVRAMPLYTGETVLLRVVPVDPRDMFRGDYVTLSYDISQAMPVGLRHAPTTPVGQKVYVKLVPEADGQHFHAGEATTSRPSSGRYIRGTIDHSGRIAFGIESYYVQEGTGLDYEAAVRRGRVSAVVAVAPDGQAALRGLRMER